MNVLLIFPRSLITGEAVDYQYLFPLGLAYISSALKEAGHSVTCLNLNHYTGPVEDLVHDCLHKGKPFDVACTGGLSTAHHQIKRVADALKTSPSKPTIVIGGGIVSSQPELMLQQLKPDYMVLGEGEKTIKELLARLETGKQTGDVPGIAYRDNDGKYVSTKPRLPIMDLESLPWPDFEGLDYETYLDNLRPTDQYFYDLFDKPRVYPIITSRSCPFLCSFCFHPIGNRYRERSLDSIMHELEVMLRRYRINLIAIYDELFAHNPVRVREFCDRIKKLLAGVPWECRWNCQMRVDRVNSDLLAMMRDAGCYAVSYGFESYSAAVLKSMKKHITPQQIDNAVRLTLEKNISIQGNFIFGDRAETLATARQTLDYWKQNRQAGIVLSYVNPYPGTELYAYCVERGIIKDELDFIENHIFDAMNMSETMSDREFLELRTEVFVSQLRYYVTAVPLSVARGENGAFTLKVKCPHCQEVVEYGNYVLPSAGFFNVMTYCRRCRWRFFMVSRAYLLLMKAAVAFLVVMPMPLKRKLLEYMGTLRGWLIKRLMLGKANMSNLKKVFFP